MSPDATCTPSVADLRAVTDALGHFIGYFLSEVLPPSPRDYEEDQFYQLFIALADTLNPVRRTAGSINGWLPKVGPALQVVIGAFDSVAADLGWGPLAEPEPRRSANRKARLARIRETIEQRTHESVQWPESVSSLLDRILWRPAKVDPAKRLVTLNTLGSSESRHFEDSFVYSGVPLRRTDKPEIGRREFELLRDGEHLLRAAVKKAEGNGRTAVRPVPIGISEILQPDAAERYRSTTSIPSTVASRKPPQLASAKTEALVSPSRRRRRGEASLFLMATLAALAEKGQWGETDRGICHLASISRDSFYRLRREDEHIKKMLSEYGRQTLGRGPARASEI
jgi:hypothetical protein